MAREEGIEPPTRRLTAACSTAELLPNTNKCGTVKLRDGRESCQGSRAGGLEIRELDQIFERFVEIRRRERATGKTVEAVRGPI
jgi:hypothetical protein